MIKMTILDIAVPFSNFSDYADALTERLLTQRLFAEARILDKEGYEEWLADFIDEKIQYWMPDMETRRRDDVRGTFCYGEAAYFDDSIKELTIRVKRYNEPSAWADNPATRHVHLISNIEVFNTEIANHYAVCSVFENIRNRNMADQDVIHGRREDIWKLENGVFKLVIRRIFIVQNVLLSKNLNTFL